MAQQIELTADPVSLKMSKGETAESSITLRNLGKNVAQFTIAIEGLDPKWYKLPVSSVALFPNDRDNVKVIVSLPDTLDPNITSYPFLVKATSQDNAADTMTVKMSVDVGPAPKLALNISPPSISGRRGSYTIEVGNPDRKECKVQLKASRPKGRLKFNLQPDALTVPAGDTKEAILNVRLNWLAMLLGEKAYDFEISAEQPNGVAAEKIIQSAQLVNIPWYRFLTRIRIPWLSRPPVIKSFQATTDNKREFLLKWAVQKSSKVQIDGSDVEAMGESILHPTENKKITLVATNRYGKTSKTIEVIPLSVPEPRTSDKIKVTISPPKLQTKAGYVPALAMVQVQNLSTIVDKFIIEVEGLDETWYSRSASSIALMPQVTDQVQITFQPPEKKGVKAGIYTFAITVRSQSMDGEYARVLGKLEILPSVQYKIKAHPYRLYGMRKVTCNLTISNTSVSETKIAIEATDLDDGCKFKIKPDSLVLGAWNTLEIPIGIRPKRNSIIGAVKRYDITFTTSAENLSPQTANCEFNHSPFMKSWKPVFRTIRTIIAIAVLVVVVVLIIKWGGGWDALKESPKDWFKQIVTSLTTTIEGWFK